MAKIIWLASYPKSGNTWARIFLANYRHDQDAPVDINHLSDSFIASSRLIFDEMAGIETSDLTPGEIEAMRPTVYRHISTRITQDIFIKVHDAYTLTQEGVPLFPAEIPQKAIYLLRNPLDVVASFAHHMNISIEKTIRCMENPAFELAETGNGLSRQFSQRLLTWSGHALSWADAPSLDVSLVRYEDLHADPEAAFGELARAAGLELDPERLRRAIRFSGFDLLQNQEQAHGFREKTPLSKSFFRKGKIGGWREEMSAAQVERVIQTHQTVMRRFGYLTANDEPVF
jgi:hypothetical protein